MEDRTPGDVLKLIKDNGIEVIDVRFCDLPGLMQHFSIPAHELTEDVFEDGLGFDGSSIRPGASSQHNSARVAGAYGGSLIVSHFAPVASM